MHKIFCASLWTCATPLISQVIFGCRHYLTIIFLSVDSLFIANGPQARDWSRAFNLYTTHTNTHFLKLNISQSVLFNTHYILVSDDTTFCMWRIVHKIFSKWTIWPIVFFAKLPAWNNLQVKYIHLFSKRQILRR